MKVGRRGNVVSSSQNKLEKAKSGVRRQGKVGSSSQNQLGKAKNGGGLQGKGASSSKNLQGKGKSGAEKKKELLAERVKKLASTRGRAILVAAVREKKLNQPYSSNYIH